MKSMFYLTYASRMTWCASVNKDVFTDIYRTSNTFNATQNITGFLCFGNGYFFQYLEGDESKVRELYANICQDSRHKQVTLLSTGYLSHRRFVAWDMAFINMHSPNIHPEMADFFSLLTPLYWQHADIERMIELFEIHCNTNQFIAKYAHADNGSAIYRYAALHHLVRQHRNFLILYSILILIWAVAMMLLYLD